MKGKTNRLKNGFTIIELVVVITIIIVLAGIVMVSVSYYNQKAKATWVLAEIKQIQKALDLYKVDYGYYPYQTGPGGDPEVGSFHMGIMDACNCDGCKEWPTFVEALTPKLVSNGYISQVKDFGDGPRIQSCFHGDGTTFFEYWTGSAYYFYTCGGKSMSGSAYGLFIKSPFPIPGLQTVDQVNSWAPYYYCVPSPQL